MELKRVISALAGNVDKVLIVLYGIETVELSVLISHQYAS